MLEILLTTVIKRPYVLAFLISYIFIAIRIVGWKWTVQFLLAGYSIAFLSEYLSINYGLPYGWYFYKYENLKGEWLNNGVPVWDSASYVFMSFSGLYAAIFALRNIHPNRQNPWLMVALSALLVTLLDVIVDPVAHMGKRWFLGEIYYYPTPGPYFDVTLANFAGWFCTSFLINAVGVFALRFRDHLKWHHSNHWLPLGLYYGIFGFGLAIAVYLQAWTLVLCDVIWLSLSIVIIFAWAYRKASLTNVS